MKKYIMIDLDDIISNVIKHLEFKGFKEVEHAGDRGGEWIVGYTNDELGELPFTFDIKVVGEISNDEDED